MLLSLYINFSCNYLKKSIHCIFYLPPFFFFFFRGHLTSSERLRSANTCSVRNTYLSVFFRIKCEYIYFFQFLVTFFPWHFSSTLDFSVTFSITFFPVTILSDPPFWHENWASTKYWGKSLISNLTNNFAQLILRRSCDSFGSYTLVYKYFDNFV